MAFTRKDEEAVSPVIGVILMVAITVILAAVIAAFALNMPGEIQKTKIVSVTLTRLNATAVTSTFDGGPNAGSLMSINWSVNGGAPTQQISGKTALPVGNSFSITAGPNSHIVGVAGFTDGSQVKIYESTI